VPSDDRTPSAHSDFAAQTRSDCRPIRLHPGPVTHGLSGWWLTYPSEKRQLGLLFPNKWKVLESHQSHVPNHQPAVTNTGFPKQGCDHSIPKNQLIAEEHLGTQGICHAASSLWCGITSAWCF